MLGNVAENTDLDRRLLAEYKVISDALDRLGKGYESVEETVGKMQRELPYTIR